jgi:N-dimethylarginine dimethylaminohydrolase
MNLLMCSPTYFNIDYSINAWMDINNKANKELSQTQWNDLTKNLIKAGATLHYVNPKEKLPDLVFTANAALIYKKTAIVSKFHNVERQGEEEVFFSWFKKNKFNTIQSEITFEGAGDALFSGNKLFLGNGFRSDLGVKEYLEYSFPNIKVIQCNLIDPRFYHLDTCFCPLDGNRALIYSPAIDTDLSDLDLIEVPEEEAINFACNSVFIRGNIVMPSNCPKTKYTLEQLGYTVYDNDMSEYLKSGGACKCLTLNLDQ